MLTTEFASNLILQPPTRPFPPLGKFLKKNDTYISREGTSLLGGCEIYFDFKWMQQSPKHKLQDFWSGSGGFIDSDSPFVF